MTTISEALAVALHYHQTGNLQQAEASTGSSCKQTPAMPMPCTFWACLLTRWGSMAWLWSTSVRPSGYGHPIHFFTITWAKHCRTRGSCWKQWGSIKRPSVSNPTSPMRTSAWAMPSRIKASWQKQ